jgi:hypothetical protein
MSVYAKQVFWEAVSALATGDGSIQERLASAAGEDGGGLMKIAQSVDQDLPEEHRDEFHAIWRELTKEGSVAATARKLSNEDGRQLATRILSIFTAIMGGL